MKWIACAVIWIATGAATIAGCIWLGEDGVVFIMAWIFSLFATFAIAISDG